MIKVIVDAMGGDNAPDEIVKGAVKALDVDKEVAVVLVGKEEVIKEKLSSLKYDSSRIEIVNASEVIDMNDIPTTAIRTKRDSSLVKAFDLLNSSDEYAGMVSAGSTGAVLTGATLKLGRMKGVKRPALCPIMPTPYGLKLLCDCGANAECKPEMMVDFAIMGSVYARVALGIENPRVGLVSNGTEEHKGDTLHQEVYKLLKEEDQVNFIGNIEGRDIMGADVCDVAVADGFSGNIALKSMEGAGKGILTILKQEIKASFWAAIAYKTLMAKAFKKIKERVDFERVGGAMLLGLNKVMVKSHGSSKAKTICPAIIQVANTYRGNLTGEMAKTLSECKEKQKLRQAQQAEQGGQKA